MKNFSKALASGDIQEIINLIRNEDSFDTESLDQLLKECKSPGDKEIIIREFNKKYNSEKLSDSIADVLESSDREKILEKEKDKSLGLVKSDRNEYEGEYESLSEDEALKKYKFSNPKYDKALEMFTNSFKANISGINFDKAVKLSKSIVEQIISEFSSTFPREVRSKSHNLKENTKLCNDVYYKKIECSDFVKMTVEQMQNEDLKSKDSEHIKNGILASQLAKSAAETDLFKCAKCKQNKCTYTQLQTRSCDEPMTTFVTCTICGNVWKF